MTREELESRILAFLGESLVVGSDVRIDPESSLLESGIIDSYTMASINDFLARDLGIGIPPDELLPENYATIGSIAALALRYASG